MEEESEDESGEVLRAKLLKKLQKRYVKAREKRGLTVAEFEAELGMPHYSVYPDCKDVSESEVGYYMYTQVKNRELSDRQSRPAWVQSEGVRPVKTTGMYGPTRLGGEQKKQGGFHWKRTNFRAGDGFT